MGEEGWEQLFSGFIGSVIAAVVAVVILLLTNRHQRTIADQQLAQQRTLANDQLADQRAESSRVRRNAVIARIIFTATQFRQTVDEQARHALVADVESAALVWEFEESNDEFFAELRFWPQLLFIESAKMFSRGDDGAAIHNQILRLSSLTYSFTSNLKRWPGADAEGRREIIGNLADARGPIYVKFLAASPGPTTEGDS